MNALNILVKLSRNTILQGGSTVTGTRSWRHLSLQTPTIITNHDQLKRLQHLLSRCMTCVRSFYTIKSGNTTLNPTLSIPRYTYWNLFSAGEPEAAGAENLVCTKTFCIPSSFFSNLSYTCTMSSMSTRWVTI
jgi:hypothetical protein